MAGILERINQVAVTSVLLAEVITIHAAMPAEDRGDLANRLCGVFAQLDDCSARDQLGQLAV